jgi:hypothetical protein
MNHISTKILSKRVDIIHLVSHLLKVKQGTIDNQHDRL